MRIGPNTPPTSRQLIPPVEPVDTTMRVNRNTVARPLHQATGPSMTRSGSIIEGGRSRPEDLVLSKEGFKVTRCSLQAPEEAELDPKTGLLKYEENKILNVMGLKPPVRIIHYYNPDTGKPVQIEKIWLNNHSTGLPSQETHIFPLDGEKELFAKHNTPNDPKLTLKYDDKFGQLLLEDEMNPKHCRPYGKAHPTNLRQFTNLLLHRLNEFLYKYGLELPFAA